MNLDKPGMKIIYKDERLSNGLEMYDTLREIGEMGSLSELYVYDITDWRMLYPDKIPEEWYAEDLHNGDGFEYYFPDEAMIASSIKQKSIPLYMQVKFVVKSNKTQNKERVSPMNIIDNRDLTFSEGDIVVADTGKKYLVIFENTCVAWHFLDLETLSFNEEIYFEVKSDLKIGCFLEGLGKVVDVIKKDNVYMSIE